MNIIGRIAQVRDIPWRAIIACSVPCRNDSFHSCDKPHYMVYYVEGPHDVDEWPEEDIIAVYAAMDTREVWD